MLSTPAAHVLDLGVGFRAFLQTTRRTVRPRPRRRHRGRHAVRVPPGAFGPARRQPHEAVHQRTARGSRAAAVRAAFQRPRAIDYDLVHARQARRFLDRVVGFTVSPLLSRRLRAALSAGRVQSAALAILAARDQKIRVFRPEEFFGVDLLLWIDGAEPVQASLVDADGGVVRFDDRGEAEALAAHLASVAVTLDEVAHKDASQRPKPPFTTSTMQRRPRRAVSWCRTRWRPRRSSTRRGRSPACARTR